MKTCPVCSAPVKGRKDKVYCSVNCKSVDQYGKRLESEQFFFQIDRQLKLNRKILKRHNQSGFTTLRRDDLHKEGFNPHFFTHYWKNQKGEVYLFCYEFGFRAIVQQEKEKYLFITWQPYMDKGQGISQ